MTPPDEQRFDGDELDRLRQVACILAAGALRICQNQSAAAEQQLESGMEPELGDGQE